VPDNFTGIPSDNRAIKEAEVTSAEKYNHIMVVDDDPGIRALIRETLVSVGYRVTTAGTPGEALSLFDANDIDVVLADWRLPEMDGIELINQLKAKSPHLAAILMTGYGTKQTIIDAFTQGRINYYLPKPFEISSLIEMTSAAAQEHKMMLSDKRFRDRLELQIHRATRELELKTRQLESQQSEIQKTKDYLENLIESSADAIISTDRQYHISLFSHGAEEMFGDISANYLGQPLEKIFATGRGELDRLLELLEAKSRLTNIETEVLQADGSRLFTDISISKLREINGHQGLLLIIKDLSERKRLEEELLTSNLILKKLSITDPLTRLNNRRYFQDSLEDEFNRSLRFNSPIGLIMLDLDDFKRVNDTFGHQVGDEVLIQAARIITESIRKIDIPARFGGEEFTVILPQTRLADTIYVAERIKEAFERFSQTQKIAPGLPVTASLGLAGRPDSGGSSPEDMIKFADQALYRAKELGKNRIVIGRRNSLEPISHVERLSYAQKQEILKGISQRLKAALNLDDVLQFLLREIRTAMGEKNSHIPVSIAFGNEKQGLTPLAEVNMDDRHRVYFDELVQEAVREKRPAARGAGSQEESSISYPMIIRNPEDSDEVIGVVSLGIIPDDTGFFEDMIHGLAVTFSNPVLYSALQSSRTIFEKKSIDGDDRQAENALSPGMDPVIDNFISETRRLLFKFIARLGFKRAAYLSGDDDSRSMDGVISSPDSGLESIKISLDGLELQTHVHPRIISYGSHTAGVEKKLFEALGMTSGEMALVPADEGHGSTGLVAAVKEKITPEELKTLSSLVRYTEPLRIV